MTLPKRVREQLGIEPNDEIPASLVGSVLKVNLNPSTKLQPATAGREEWTASTPMDAAEALFGSTDDHEQ